MRYITGTQYRASTFKITIKALKTCMIYIWVSDAKIANTYLTKRFYSFSPGQEQTFYVQMPLTGQNTITQIFDNPAYKDSDSSSFVVTGFKKMASESRISTLGEISGITRGAYSFNNC